MVGTGTLTYRKPEQKVFRLPELGPVGRAELERGGSVAVVFGPEKHGLTREDLSYCHLLVEIPTDARQPSMNLGQAVAVCLYELATRGVAGSRRGVGIVEKDPNSACAASGELERLAGVVRGDHDCRWIFACVDAGGEPASIFA